MAENIEQTVHMAGIIHGIKQNLDMVGIIRGIKHNIAQTLHMVGIIHNIEQTLRKVHKFSDEIKQTVYMVGIISDFEQTVDLGGGHKEGEDKEGRSYKIKEQIHGHGGYHRDQVGHGKKDKKKKK